MRASNRLTDSAACLVVADGTMSAHLERMLKAMGRADEVGRVDRVLELNASHPAVQTLAHIHAAKEGDPRVESFGRLLYDQAVLAEGSRPADPAAFARRINELIVAAR